MTHEPFLISFAPRELAVNLLAQIANDDISPHQKEAQVALASWRQPLATPTKIVMVDTGDELEIDDAGACVSEGNDGFFIQTWTWCAADAFRHIGSLRDPIECDMSTEDKDCDECGCTPEDQTFEGIAGRSLCVDCAALAKAGA